MGAGRSRCISASVPTKRRCARWSRRLAGSRRPHALVLETLAPTDWVRQGLEGLTPVEAGRFVVHGAHDRARVRANRIAIEIEAALAFGTGHHGTTRGCLIALDRLVKECGARRAVSRIPGGVCSRAATAALGRESGRVLDIGTGTGVLAIAAAKALRKPVLASDIDARAVVIARENARLNRAAAPCRGDPRRRPLRPAVSPARALPADPRQYPARAAASSWRRRWRGCSRRTVGWCCPGCSPAQAVPALASYRARGLVLVRRIRLEGWMTLVLVVLQPPRSHGQVDRAAAGRADPTPTAAFSCIANALFRCARSAQALPCGSSIARLPTAPYRSPSCSRPASSRSRIAPSARPARRASRRCAPSSRGADLTGFIVPRADRHQNEYVPACEERLAWLTGFTGSAGTAIVLDGARGAVRRRPLYAAGARAGRRRAVRDRASGRDAAGALDREQPRRPTTASATTPGCTRPRAPNARQGLRRGRRNAGGGRARPDRRHLDATALRRRSARSRCTTCALPARRPRTSSRASARKWRSCAPTRWSYRIRTRSPGPSTSAAPTWPHTPLPLAFAIVPKARPAFALRRRPQALERRAPPPRRRSPTFASPPISCAHWASSASDKKTVRLDQATAADALARLVEQPRRQGRARRRPDRADEGGEERDRDRRRARGACPRRRGGRALPRLARARGAARLAHRDRRGRGARKLPPRHRAAQGCFVSDHRRRRARRRHRALPRHHQDRPPHRARRIVPDRFRRPIRGRHHRHHPHRRGRRADAPRCATASPACSRATSRSRARYFPTARPARSSIRSRASSCGSQGLDFDHGTGHGVGSYLSVHEGPARISKLGTARAQARHDPVERARLLQDRRLRHPHREPGAGGRGAGGARRREAAQRVRDAHAGADRPAAGRGASMLTPEETRLARPLSRAGREATLSPLRRRRDPRLARRRHPPARGSIERCDAVCFARSDTQRRGRDRNRAARRGGCCAADRDDGGGLALAQHPGAGDSRPGGEVRHRSRPASSSPSRSISWGSRWRSWCSGRCPTASAAGRWCSPGSRSRPSPAPPRSSPPASPA